MRRRPSPTHHRVGVTRTSITIVVTGGVLGLVLWLPIDRATLVGSIIAAVATSAVPMLLGRTEGFTARRRSSR